MKLYQVKIHVQSASLAETMQDYLNELAHHDDAGNGPVATITEIETLEGYKNE